MSDQAPTVFGNEVCERLAAVAVDKVKRRAKTLGVRVVFTQAETKCIEMGAYAAIIEVQDYLTEQGVLREEPNP